jgi:hypothetical protein
MSNDFFNAVQSAAGDKALPPVHLWNPESCGDIDIRIDMQGRWYHEGTLIKRQKLVDLFSSVLKKEGEDYFLVTPVEKCRIQVEIAPLLIVEWDVQHAGKIEQTLTFKTQQGHWVTANDEHPISLQTCSEGAYPVIHIRSGLNALVSRNVYYQLAELIDTSEKLEAGELSIFSCDNQETLNGGQLGIISCGVFFPLQEA